MSIARWLRSVFAPEQTTRQPIPRRPIVERLERRDCPAGGSLDPTFGTGGVVTTDLSSKYETAFAVAVQPTDGKILAAGNAWGDFGLARYRVDGSPDTSFGTQGTVVTDFKKYNSEVRAVAVQPGTGGKILVAGRAETPKGYDFAVARFNPDGTLDTTFAGRGNVLTDLSGRDSSDVAWGMAVLPDGRFLLAGQMNSTLALARYTAAGNLDPTFGSGGKVLTGIPVTGFTGPHPTVSVALQGDGKAVVVTAIQSASSSSNKDLLIARFNPNGSFDQTFGSGGQVRGDFGWSELATSLAIQPDGKIVVGGTANSPDVSDTHFAILARYNADGSVDSGFGTGGATAVTLIPGVYQTRTTGVAVQADGKIVASEVAVLSDGTFHQVFGVARFNQDGSLDTSYGPNGTGFVTTTIGDVHADAYAITLQPDGRAVLVGEADDHFALARFLPSGPAVTAFTAAPAGADVSLAITASGRNPGTLGGVTQVAVYADSDGDGVLESASDLLLGYASYDATSGQWRLTVSTAGWTAGTYRLFAQAKDGYGALGDPFALTFTLTA